MDDIGAGWASSGWQEYYSKIYGRLVVAESTRLNVIFIDKEFDSFSHIKTSDDLYSHVVANLPAGEENYLLIDEVQDIVDYEKALRSLYAEDRCQIIVTGSNAYMFF